MEYLVRVKGILCVERSSPPSSEPDPAPLLLPLLPGGTVDPIMGNSKLRHVPGYPSGEEIPESTDGLMGREAEYGVAEDFFTGLRGGVLPDSA